MNMLDFILVPKNFGTTQHDLNGVGTNDFYKRVSSGRCPVLAEGAIFNVAPYRKLLVCAFG